MKAQPPTAAAAHAICIRRRSAVARASRARRKAMARTLEDRAWRLLGRTLGLGEGHERAVHALHARDARLPGSGGGELRAAGGAEVAVGDDAERLAEPAVTGDRHRAVEVLV